MTAGLVKMGVCMQLAAAPVSSPFQQPLSAALLIIDGESSLHM